MDFINVQIKQGDFVLPQYETENAAGMDVYANIDEEMTLLPGVIQIIPTGLHVAIPDGYEMQVRSRSGKSTVGLVVMNAPGTVDSDYRGEVGVILANLGHEPKTIRPMDRIAQLVFAPVVRATWRVVDELPLTKRGSGGFGHTGR